MYYCFVINRLNLSLCGDLIRISSIQTVKLQTHDILSKTFVTYRHTLLHTVLNNKLLFYIHQRNFLNVTPCRQSRLDVITSLASVLQPKANL